MTAYTGQAAPTAFVLSVADRPCQKSQEILRDDRQHHGVQCWVHLINRLRGHLKESASKTAAECVVIRPIAVGYRRRLKRIEIATVLARGTVLSVFDEPEAGIDLWSFKSLIEVFERMRSANSERTIVVISHQERILNIADEIIVLGGGKIMAHGSKEEILPTLLGTSSAVSACGQLTKGGEQ